MTNLTIGMHVPFSEKQKQLLLCKMYINFSERNHVERKIPASILYTKQTNSASVTIKFSDLKGNIQAQYIFITYNYSYPWIFPFIRHRYHISVKQMCPVMVAPHPPFLRWCRLVWIPLQPILHHIVIKLFAPQQASIRLSRHSPLIHRFICNQLKPPQSNANN